MTYTKTNKKHIIDKQSDIELQIIMRSIYLQHSTNLEYKYFAGTKDPIEVINKYRTRGFTTILNDKERIKMIKYSYDVEKWRDLYDIKTLSKSNTDRLFKPLDLGHKLFKPLKNYGKPNLYFNQNIYNGYHTPIINENGYVIPLNKNSLQFNKKT